ncbi:helix-turn-helix domain-containing protein [Thioclava sp. BHET1]|nr:helix-turn-helix domain-containing protein [Thioclava sp. BHET1]
MKSPLAPLPKLLSVRALILKPILARFDDDLSTMRNLLHRHGIDSRVLDDPYAPVALTSYLALFESAAQMLGDPLLGIRLGSLVRPGNLGPIGLRAVQSSSIRRGFDSLARFTSALQSGTELSFEQEGNTLHLRYVITTPLISPSRQDSEFTLSGICSVIRRGFDPRWRPLEVHFSHSAPDAPLSPERWFNAPVLYGQPANMLVIDPKSADQIYREEDPDMIELIDRHLAELIEVTHRDQSICDQVRALIALNLGAKPIDIATISGMLRMSRRSLQRRLAEEGTTLSEMLQDYRRGRAEAMLRDRRTSIEAIASALGYADGTAFWRAYRSWTGHSPSRAKAELPPRAT